MSTFKLHINILEGNVIALPYSRTKLIKDKIEVPYLEAMGQKHDKHDTFAVYYT